MKYDLYTDFFFVFSFLSGYMSPEYAMHGRFSVKSDVFSFGVMVLEIISGKKNSCSFDSYRVDDLLSSVSIKLLLFSSLYFNFTASPRQQIKRDRNRKEYLYWPSMFLAKQRI